MTGRRRASGGGAEIAQTHAAQASSLFGVRLARRTVLVVLVLAMALCVSIIVEWIGMKYWWPEQGVNHSHTMLLRELEYIVKTTDNSPWVKDPERVLEQTLLTVDRWVKGTHLSSILPLDYELIANGYYSAVNSTKVFVLRLMVMTLSTPTFVLFGIVGLMRGLVGRELRRWGGGRESSGMYHLYMKMLPESFIALWFVYLSMPFTLNPFFIVGPAAVIFSILVANTSYRLKKYL